MNKYHAIHVTENMQVIHSKMYVLFQWHTSVLCTVISCLQPRESLLRIASCWQFRMHPHWQCHFFQPPSYRLPSQFLPESTQIQLLSLTAPCYTSVFISLFPSTWYWLHFISPTCFFLQVLFNTTVVLHDPELLCMWKKTKTKTKQNKKCRSFLLWVVPTQMECCCGWSSWAQHR